MSDPYEVFPETTETDIEGMRLWKVVTVFGYDRQLVVGLSCGGFCCCYGVI